MNTNVWIKTSLAAVIALTVAGCGSRGGDGIDILPTKSVSSNVSLGNPVSGSTCTIAPLNNSGLVLDTATTDAAGDVTFEVPEDVGLTVITCSGGTFTPKDTNTFSISSAYETRRAGVLRALNNSLTSLFTRFFLTLPANTITSAADITAQSANILKAIGLEGLSYDAIVSGTLTSDQQKLVNLYVITLISNPSLFADLLTAIVNGNISSSLASQLGSALLVTNNRLPASERPATVPAPTGGNTTPTGGTGTGGST